MISIYSKTVSPRRQADPDIRRPIWVPPWGYAEGWVIVAGLWMVGFGLHIAGGGLRAEALAWPVNAYVALCFSLAVVLAHWFGRKQAWGAWLGRIPASICSMAGITFLLLIMGFILQDDAAAPAWIRRLGLSHITRSWPFLLSLLFFLTTLGMATMKRMWPFRLSHVGFLLNHLGLYLAVLAGVLGAADVERLLMELRQGELVWHAMDREGRVYEMPLAMELVRFDMEEYPPKLAVVESESHRLIPGHQAHSFAIADTRSHDVEDWQVEVLRFMPLAMPVEERYEPVMEMGAGPAAEIRVTHRITGDQRHGWITCGSFAFPHRLFPLTDDWSLAMTVPRASAYRSHVILYTPADDARSIVIEVNKPHAVDGWKLYQHSYDDRFGRWSMTSTIEAIRDPWLPVVYVGLFLMLAGAVYILFKGRPKDTGPDATGGMHASF